LNQSGKNIFLSIIEKLSQWEKHWNNSSKSIGFELCSKRLTNSEEIRIKFCNLFHLSFCAISLTTFIFLGSLYWWSTKSTTRSWCTFLHCYLYD
jgi:hypothetical protein